MEIVKHEAGDVNAEIKIENGNIKITAGLKSSGVKAAAQIEVESDYFLDQLAAAIPGQIDDAVISMLKVALKAV